MSCEQVGQDEQKKQKKSPVNQREARHVMFLNNFRETRMTTTPPNKTPTRRRVSLPLRYHIMALLDNYEFRACTTSTHGDTTRHFGRIGGAVACVRRESPGQWRRSVVDNSCGDGGATGEESVRVEDIQRCL